MEDLESSDSHNDRSDPGEEKVINIIVIQETPGWKKSSRNNLAPENVHVQDTASSQIRRKQITTKMEQPSFPSHANNPVCRSQSFIINSSINSAASTSSSGCSQVQFPVEYIANLEVGDNGAKLSSGFEKDDTCQVFPQCSTLQYNLDSNNAVAQELLANSDISRSNRVAHTDEEGWASGQKKVKLGLYSNDNNGCSASSLYLNGQNQQVSSSSSISKLSSSTKKTPQVYLSSSSLPFSPVIATSSFSLQPSAATADPVTPTISTTPDSGFYTPSHFESSSSNSHSTTSANPFFTSTPRRSSTSGPHTSTPFLMETPRRVESEGLRQKFTEFYNAMDWENLDDSGGMSDPKEGCNDSRDGESSPNSSLRSVQWLKGFSFGESVKPLLSSPPTPSDKNKKPTCTDPPSNAAVTSTLTTTQASVFASQPCLTPLPVIMAPRIPTYLQSRCVITPSSSSTSSSMSSSAQLSLCSSTSSSVSGVSTQGASALSTSTIQNQDNGGSGGCSSDKKNSQRKALEELKMNKPERNIGRSKFTGKIFTRPGYSYMDLIKMAMQSSEEGEMTLKQIVTWIEDHFPFFKHEAKDSWKSSIRHNLSLHSDFMKADDKKHGCKWKLCNDVAHPNLHIPAPQEMTSVQTAYLKRVNKNLPQPILPKVNAYALVPIQNLTTPVAETVASAGQQLPPPPALTAMPRKPIHILPKQADESMVLHPMYVPEEGSILEAMSHQQVYEMVSHDTPSEQHQVIQHLLQKGPQNAHTVVPSLLEDQTMFSGSGFISEIPSMIYQSSDSNSNQSMSFPSLRSFDQSLPSTSQFVDANIDNGLISCVEAERPVQDFSGCSYTMEQDNSTGSTSHSVQSISSQNESHSSFPLNSVVEVRHEKGANPGEKKIVFVLQEGETSKRMKKVERPGGGYSRKSSKNLSEIFEQQETVNGKSTSSSKAFGFGGGKKKAKEGLKGHRQHRGPVLNLQSVLQSSLVEDKKASDTIGQLLQEEDESKRLVSVETRSGSSGGGFTHVKSFSEREESLHFNSHMQRALQEQSANIMSQTSSLGNEYRHLNEADDSNDASGSQEKLQDKSQILPRAGSRLWPFPSGKRNTSLKDRMAMAKSRNSASSDSFVDVSSSSVGSIEGRGSSSGQDPSISRFTTRSASQLVFRRLSSGSFSNLSSDSLQSHTLSSFSEKSSVVAGDCDTSRESCATSCRKVGKILRTKSRRKQVHIPLTSEISPMRKKSHMLEDDDVIVDDENAQFMEISNNRECEMNYDITVKAEQLPASLCTNVQQPSLKILQERPLEKHDHSPHTALKPRPKSSQGEVFGDISLPHNQINANDIDKVIENIFTCSGSPIKVETSDKNKVLSIASNAHISTAEQSSSEFDLPPSMLHFLSTFPKDMEFSFNENHKASHHDDIRNSAIHPGLSDTRISSLLSPSNHHNKKSNHFLHTPSPPSRYPSATNKSIQKTVSTKEENKGFCLVSGSPASPAREACSIGNSSTLSWNTNNLTMYTPPCGSILQSSSSYSVPSKSPFRTSSVPTLGESQRVTLSEYQLSKTLLSSQNDLDLANTNKDNNNCAQTEQWQHQQQTITLPPHTISMSNNESNNDEDEQSLTSSSVRQNHHLCSSTALPLTSTSSSPIDLTRFTASSYSLITPPCGNAVSSAINNTVTITNDAITSSNLTHNVPLFLSVPGTSMSPIFLSPTSSNSGSNQPHLHPDLFPSLTPESALDPSIMENLDLFLNNMPVLSPGLSSIQLSPHS